MAIEIRKLADDVPYSNILVYGDSGAGKTVLAGSDLRVLFLAPEDSGTLSALRMGSKADKINIHCWEDLKEAYSYLYDHPEVTDKYDWLAIDSMTEMQYMAKDYVLRSTRAKKLSKDQDPEKMQLEDYGVMHALLETLVRAFNDLPVNIIYTATAKKVEDAEANEFLVPDIQGKKEYGIAMKMAALMTSYGYLRTEIHAMPVPVAEGEEPKFKNVKRRVIYFEDTGVIRGKDRTITLAPFVVNATLQQIRRAMKGEFARSSDGSLAKRGATNNGSQMPKTAKKGVVQASPEPVKEVESKPEADAPKPEPELDGAPVTTKKDEESVPDAMAEIQA